MKQGVASIGTEILELHHTRNYCTELTNKFFRIFEELQATVENMAMVEKGARVIKVEDLKLAFIDARAEINLVNCKAEALTRDPFSELPRELLLEIFRFMGTKQLFTSSCVCKRFHEVIYSDIPLYKLFCLEFWKKHDFGNCYDLETAVKRAKKFDPILDWMWVSKCFAKVEGYTWMEDKADKSRWENDQSTHRILIGNTDDGKGIEIKKTGDISAGAFKNHSLEGEGVFYSHNHSYYQGGWTRDNFQGRGFHFEAPDGPSYDGEFVENERHGYGVMLWEDGFQYKGCWEVGQPIDIENAVHPKIRECVATGRCTASVTGKSIAYPQVVYDCDHCGASICQVCKDSNCRQGVDHKWTTEWCTGAYCNCGEDCHIIDRYEGPPLKKRKQN